MASVNELAARWRNAARNRKQRKLVTGRSIQRQHAEELEQVARTAWHPVSEPPTEADGDAHQRVLVRRAGRSQHDIALLTTGSDLSRFEEWARIRDVILMPPEDK